MLITPSTSRLYVGVPVVIGAGGVEWIVEIKLSAPERKMFQKSVDAVVSLNAVVAKLGKSAPAKKAAAKKSAAKKSPAKKATAKKKVAVKPKKTGAVQPAKPFTVSEYDTILLCYTAHVENKTSKAALVRELNEKLKRNHSIKVYQKVWLGQIDKDTLAE